MHCGGLIYMGKERSPVTSEETYRVDGSDATRLEDLVMGHEDFVSNGFSFS